jgi:hypothetical protein
MDGLNIATKVGDGQAGVIDWSGFHNTLNQIYQRDIDNHKAASLAYDRSAMEVNKMADGIRSEDLEDFKGASEAYKQASLMLMNPKIKRDAQESAKWQRAKDEAFFTSMQVANESKKEALRQHELNAKYLKSNGADFNENYLEIADKVKGLPTKAIKQNRLDNEGAYLLAKDPQKETERFSNVVGKLSAGKVSQVISKDGMQQKVSYSYPSNVRMVEQKDGSYKPSFEGVIHGAAKFIMDNPKFHNSVKGDYNRQFPQERYKIMLQAQALQPDFKIQDDEVNYFIANSILEANSAIKKEEDKATPIGATYSQKMKDKRIFKQEDLQNKETFKSFSKKIDKEYSDAGIDTKPLDDKIDNIVTNAKQSKANRVEMGNKTLYLTPELNNFSKNNPVGTGKLDLNGVEVKKPADAAIDDEGNAYLLLKNTETNSYELKGMTTKKGLYQTIEEQNRKAGIKPIKISPSKDKPKAGKDPLGLFNK